MTTAIWPLEVLPGSVVAEPDDPPPVPEPTGVTGRHYQTLPQRPSPGRFEPAEFPSPCYHSQLPTVPLLYVVMQSGVTPYPGDFAGVWVGLTTGTTFDARAWAGPYCFNTTGAIGYSQVLALYEYMETYQGGGSGDLAYYTANTALLQGSFGWRETFEVWTDYPPGMEPPA